MTSKFRMMPKVVLIMVNAHHTLILSINFIWISSPLVATNEAIPPTRPPLISRNTEVPGWNSDVLAQRLGKSGAT